MKYIFRFTLGAIMLVLSIPFILGCMLFSLWNWNYSGNYAIEEMISIIEDLIKNRHK